MSNKTIFKQLPLNDKQKEITKTLTKQGVHPLLSKIFSQRKIQFLEELNPFLPFISFSLLKDIDKAVFLLHKHIESNNKICIVADYDADGATACAIGILGLRMFGANIDYVVPNRFIHGYGLTPSVVDEAIEKTQPNLIITVDNGISSIEGIDYANSKNINVLVTDHHLQGDTLPNAACIVNPNQNDCPFPSKSLAGCAVMFYVICALSFYYKSKSLPFKNDISSLLDLVAIGTISDLVPLDENNRRLVKQGMIRINEGKARPGINALIEICNKKPESLGTTDIAFGIGPRINAAGRLEDMTIGINCLISQDHKEALSLASLLHEINNKRKEIETDIKEEALLNLDLVNYPNICVSYGADFHEGVIGIVASRLKELHYKPTIVFTNVQDNNNEIKGSGRSIEGIHLRDVLDYIHKKDDSIFIKFGGHAMAAGMTIHKQKLEDFCQLFNEAVSFYSKNKELVDIRFIDATLNKEDITIDNAMIINQQIWGQHFPPPLFNSQCTIVEQSLIGNNKHLSLKVQIDNQIFKAIYFFKDSLIEAEQVNLFYQLSVNEFRDVKSIQLLINGFEIIS